MLSGFVKKLSTYSICPCLWIGSYSSFYSFYKNIYYRKHLLTMKNNINGD